MRREDEALATDDSMSDRYALYEEDDAELGGRGPLRGRKAARHHARKQRMADDMAELAGTTGLEDGFNPSYKPSRWEAAWLLASSCLLFSILKTATDWEPALASSEFALAVKFLF